MSDIEDIKSEGKQIFEMDNIFYVVALETGNIRFTESCDYYYDEYFTKEKAIEEVTKLLEAIKKT